MKTLPVDLKRVFVEKGVTLTAQQEHIAAEAQEKGAINWSSLLAALSGLGTHLPQIISFITGLIAAFSGGAAAPKTATAGCCDHKCCCAATLKAAIHTVDCASKHMCECCCEGC